MSPQCKHIEKENVDYHAVVYMGLGEETKVIYNEKGDKKS